MWASDHSSLSSNITSLSTKVDAIVGLAVDILSEESSIVIFTTFVAVAKLIHEKLDERQWAGELLTGETVPKKRQAMVDRFQAGLSPVFVCTYGAGGVGLTLTGKSCFYAFRFAPHHYTCSSHAFAFCTVAACTVILVDRPWTPGDVNQAEDRVGHYYTISCSFSLLYVDRLFQQLALPLDAPR